jgi:hypothetical protein
MTHEAVDLGVHTVRDVARAIVAAGFGCQAEALDEALDVLAGFFADAPANLIAVLADREQTERLLFAVANHIARSEPDAGLPIPEIEQESPSWPN